MNNPFKTLAMDGLYDPRLNKPEFRQENLEQICLALRNAKTKHGKFLLINVDPLINAYLEIERYIEGFQK